MSLEGVVLDHVAVAVESWAAAWPRYVVELGGEWASGGQSVGFAPHQLRFANGARLEVLQPWEVGTNPFLRRFLDSSGPGPHHLTFKVPDISGAIEEAEAAGFTPVAVDLSDPGWMEAFLHPRQASGIVVQLAQAAGSWQSPVPEGFPTARLGPPSTLRHVTHAVADLEEALALFSGLLGGRPQPAQSSSGADVTVVTLHWDGPLTLRLVCPEDSDTALSRWLDGRAGRLHHLAFEVPRAVIGHIGQLGAADLADGVPGQTVGVVAGESARGVVEPDDNLGTRLVLMEDGASSSSEHLAEPR